MRLSVRDVLSRILPPRGGLSLPCSQAQDGQATLWLSVIAFGKQADFLAKHQKGDVASVSGT
ncbi:hypothetical protein ACSLPA_33540, partial [Escherichia coli]